VSRRTRRTEGGIAGSGRHDDGDAGVRGGTVQHLFGARRADMLLRGDSLHHEVRTQRRSATRAFHARAASTDRTLGACIRVRDGRSIASARDSGRGAFSLSFSVRLRMTSPRDISISRKVRSPGDPSRID